MNKTISTSLAGLVFHVEEHGYEKLRQYLEEIRVRLGNSQDVEEIMADIEGRIAELFFERTKDRKEVVTLNDVEEVIKIMGAPSDYAEGSETENEIPFEESDANRKMYRNDDDRMIGGVCSGIADYFGWEATWVRLFFLVLFFFGGSGVLLYIALWIILPVATTTAEKLQARGKKVTSKSIEDHIKKFRKDVEDLGKHPNTQRFRTAGSQLAHGFGRIAGFAALVTGAILMIILIYWVVTKDFIIPITNNGSEGFSINDLMNVTFTHWQKILFDLGIICIFAGPIIGCFAFATRMFFQIKRKIKTAAIVSAGTWIFGVILICVVALGVYRERSSTDELSSQTTIETSSDFVVMDIQEDIHFHNSFTNTEDYFFELLKTKNDTLFVGWPKIDIVTSDNNKFQLEVIRESYGRTKKDAIRNAEAIVYDVEIIDNKIYVPPYFSFHVKHKYKGQSIKVLLRVPEGKSVKLTDRMDRVLYDVGEEDEQIDEGMAGKTWTMYNKRLLPGIIPIRHDTIHQDTTVQS